MNGESGKVAETTAAAAPASAVEPARTRTATDRFIGRRAKKPKRLAVVLDACTGCAGSPVCQVCCPVEDCMLLEATGDAYPYVRIRVDTLKCVGCRKCVRQGPDGSFLDGCPWDAIEMMPTAEWEEEHGRLPY